MEPCKRKASLFSFALILFITISFCEVKALSEGHHHAKLQEGSSVVEKEQRKTLHVNEFGEITAANVTEGHKELPYHLEFITLEPNSLFLPVLLHAEMVFYVHTGSGKLTWADDGSSSSISLRAGDVCSLREGSVFYIQSNLESERRKLRIYAMFSNTEDNTYDPSIGAYSRISELVKGFDKKIMQAAFKVPEDLIEAITNSNTSAIVHAVSEKKNIVEELEISLLKNFLGVGDASNSKKVKTYNIFDNDPDLKTENGWSITVTKKQLKSLKDTNTGFLMVHLSLGSILGPHWNPKAAELSVVVEGEGIVRTVCGSRNHSETECEDMRFKVKEGDAFVVPRFHPMAQMSFQNVTFVFIGFSTSAKNNHPQFLAGKRSVLHILDKQILATSLGVSNQTVDQLLHSPPDSAIFACCSCAEEEQKKIEEEEARKREEEKQRKEEEEARKREEEEKQRKEEEEEEKRRKEEEEARKREEEEKKRKEEEEEEKKKKEEEIAKREQEERERQRAEEEARREQEKREEEEKKRKEEEEARKREEGEKKKKEEDEAREREEEEEREEEIAKREQEERERKRAEEEARREQEREKEREREEEIEREKEKWERRRQEEEARREAEEARKEEGEARREQERKREEKMEREKEKWERRRQEEEARREAEAAARRKEEARREAEESAESEQEQAESEQERRERRRQEEEEREQEQEGREPASRRGEEEEETTDPEQEQEQAERQQKQRERRRREEVQRKREGEQDKREEEESVESEQEQAKREQEKRERRQQEEEEEEERERRRDRESDNEYPKREDQSHRTSFKGRRVLKLMNV